jgi:D-sedoheptulose 7-phosphate isomerase
MTEIAASHVEALVRRRPDLAVCVSDLTDAYGLIADAFAAGGKLLVCGNGGSAADSEHIVGELMKGFLLPRPLPDDLVRLLAQTAGPDGAHLASRLQGALPAIALTSHLALTTAIGNDSGPDLAFAQQVYGLGRPGDVLLGISTSGNAKNVVNAFLIARSMSVRTVVLTGATGGALTPLADVAICAPADHVVEIQEMHLPLYHTLCSLLEAHFFGEDRTAPDALVAPSLAS